MLNRKGFGELLFFFAVFFVIIGIALMYQATIKKDDTSRFIGESQVDAFDAYAESEELRLSLQEEVRFAAYESLLEYSENGGFGDGNSCEKRNNVVIWDFNKCWPDLEKNFAELFKKNLDEKGFQLIEREKIVKNGETEKVVPENSYHEIKLTDNKIEVDFGKRVFNKKSETSDVVYEREYVIREDVYLDFKELQDLKRKLLEAKQTGDYTGIVEGEISEYIDFSIENDKKVLTFENNGLIAKEPVFKFAVKV